MDKGLSQMSGNQKVGYELRTLNLNIIKVDFLKVIQVCSKYKRVKKNCKPIFNKTK